VRAFSIALVALVALVALGACRAHAPPTNVTLPAAGITIAIYNNGLRSYAIVDDRRWVDVSGPELALANLDPDAELASLVIEPASAVLRVGTCTRYDRVRCRVFAAPGRYLLRLVYVTSGIGYRAQHDIAVRDATRATIASRFSVQTPAWRSRAEIVLFDGMPGGRHPPREVARGATMLDGSTATVAATTREARAGLRRIYEGAVVTSSDSSDVAWGNDSVQAVWVWLELEGLRLAPGPIRVQLELPEEGARDVEVSMPRRTQSDAHDAVLRLPLWVDESLRGSRMRIVELSEGATLVERCVFSVANSGDTARVVFIDEPLRRAARRKLDRAWPHKPVLAGERLRTKLVIEPGGSERTGYTLTYDF
jgi:hypothetical protein